MGDPVSWRLFADRTDADAYAQSAWAVYVRTIADQRDGTVENVLTGAKVDPDRLPDTALDPTKYPVFGIDGATGRLIPTGHSAGVPTPVCVKVL